jgi:hypothetical protein
MYWHLSVLYEATLPGQVSSRGKHMVENRRVEGKCQERQRVILFCTRSICECNRIYATEFLAYMAYMADMDILPTCK